MFKQQQPTIFMNIIRLNLATVDGLFKYIKIKAHSVLNEA